MVTRQKIWVTGAGGQLGSELRKLSISYPLYEFIFHTRDNLPIEKEEYVRNFFEKHNPQYCINCAAFTAVDRAESEKDIAYIINAEAVGMLASVCKEFNTHFTHISTDYVFDGNSQTPYKEDALTNPQGVYGESKLKGEKLAMQNNPDSLIIRTSWVYSEFGKNFVKTMIGLMHQRPEINVVNDQVGSPTYAADLADAIMKIILYPDSSVNKGLFHYSNTGVISWFDFAVAIKEMIGSHCKVNPIPTEAYPTPAKRPAYSVLDTNKIRETFKLELKDWKESLATCIKVIHQHRKIES